MAKGLTLDIGANTRDVVRGAKDAADALEGIGDALDDLTDETRTQAKRAGDNLEKGVKAGAKDAGTAVEKLETSFKDMARAAQDSSKRAGDGLGDDVSRGARKAGDGVQEFGRESNSTLKETAASVRSVEDGIGAIQEIAANAFAGFGPVGAGVGLVGALGLGLVTAELEKQKERADEFKKAINEAYLGAAADGRDFLSQTELIALAQANSSSEGEEGIKRRKKLSEELGVSMGTLLLAEAGGVAEVAEVEAALEVARKKYYGEEKGRVDFGNAAANERAGLLEAEASKLDEVTKATANGRQANRELTEAQKAGAKSQADAQNAAIGGYASQVLAANSVRDAVNGIPNKTVSINVDLGQAKRDLDSFISKQRSIGVNVRVAGVNSVGGITP